MPPRPKSKPSGVSDNSHTFAGRRKGQRPRTTPASDNKATTDSSNKMWPTLFEYKDGVMVGEAPDDSDDLLPAKRVKVAHGGEIRAILSQSEVAPIQANALPSISSKHPSTSGPTNSILSPELQHLQDIFTVTHINIISSSSMHSKIVSLVSKFNGGTSPVGKDGKDPGMSPLVVLTSKGKVASKMISIVEVSKETIRKQPGSPKLYQYSKLQGQTSDGEPKEQKDKEHQEARYRARVGRSDIANHQQHASISDDNAVVEGNDADDNQNESEGEDFETMERAGPLIEPFPDLFVEWRTKLQPVPILTIFLSLVPVKELRDMYGEQIDP